MTEYMHDPLPVGTRVRFKHRVDRYPDFVVPEGATGIVSTNARGDYGVRLDVPLKGAEEWNNEVMWYASSPSIGDPRDDIEELPEEEEVPT